MSLHPHHQNDLMETEADLLAAVSHLEQNTKATLDSRRGNRRVEISCKVFLQRGNVSDRHLGELTGVCRDVSAQGCRLIMEQPIAVGDIYLVTFQDEELGCDPVFGRCIRCHLLREDTFECGVNFLSPFEFSQAESNASETENALDFDLG